MKIISSKVVVVEEEGNERYTVRYSRYLAKETRCVYDFLLLLL